MLNLPTGNYANWVEIDIIATGGVPVSFGGFSSQGNAGGIYITNGFLNINNMLIDTSSAATDGGLIYADGQVQVTITTSKV